VSDAVPWWQEAFAADYLQVYAHRDAAAAAAEIAGLAPHLGHGPVLDACCGNGRHLAALRARGVAAVGFDWSRDLLVASGAPGLGARADVREIPFAGGFSTVLVLFTAFGYFAEEDNARTLAGLARQVAPGGRLLLDLPDPARVRATLVPLSRKEVGGLVVAERWWLDENRVLKEVRIQHPDGRVRAYTESVRLYVPDELIALAAGAGLRVVERWASLRGATADDGRHVWWLSPDPGAG
jgi:SAM-dependent methyltransferase